MNTKIPFCLLVLILVLFSCSETKQEREVANIKAFAKCYGYVRWFHPSDEAQGVNWSKFIPYGIAKVKDAPNEDALRDSLRELFTPIAPSIKIVASNKDYQYNFNSILPQDTTGMKPTYWQHNGVDLCLLSNMYRSMRVNKASKTMNISKLAICNYFRTDNYKGKKIRIRAAVKINGGNDETFGNLHLASIGNEPEKSCVLGKVHKIKNRDWKVWEKKVIVKDPDVYIDFGCYLEGLGEMYVDDLIIEYKDSNKWVSMFKDNFEKPLLANWKTYNNEFDKSIVQSDSYSGKSCLKIKNTGQLFDRYLKFGALTEKLLTSRTKVFLPLVLMTDENHVYPIGEKECLYKLNKEMDLFKGDKEIIKYADVIEYWNVMKYFHPHINSIEGDWNEHLDLALNNIYSPLEELRGESSLSYLCNVIGDGHTGLHGVEIYYNYFPFHADVLEDKLIVTNSVDSKIKNGDELLTIDGKDIIEEFKTIARGISGREEYKNYLASHFWKRFPKECIKKIGFKRGAVIKEVDIKVSNIWCARRSFSRKSVIDTLNYTYVNLEKVPLLELKRLQTQKRSQSHYFIYDLRGFSNYMPFFILPDSLRMGHKSQGGTLPQVLSPDDIKQSKLGFEPCKESVSVCKNNIFLVCEKNISNEESFIDFVHELGYGITIGNYTTGANGNINMIPLPSGKNLFFTGVKYIYHDGKSYYKKGLKPDVYVKQTIEGIINNRDDVLNKAIEIVKNGGIRKSINE